MSDGVLPFNTVAWFQISTDAPEVARAFYGSLFDWQFADADETVGTGYEMISYAGAQQASGGLATSAGGFPKGAIFSVLVRDVTETCAQAEEQGAKVLIPPATTPNGLVFAELADPAGNHFGVFTPPAG